MIIRRRFANISEGQIHYYTANEEARNNGSNPVILLTASPFSARVLSPIISEVSNTRWCVAPDHLGQGDSCSPLNQSPDIEYFGKKLIEFLDNLEISIYDINGKSISKDDFGIRQKGRFEEHLGYLLSPIFSSGIYFLHIDGDGVIIKQKFTILK